MCCLRWMGLRRIDYELRDQFARLKNCSGCHLNPASAGLGALSYDHFNLSASALRKHGWFRIKGPRDQVRRSVNDADFEYTKFPSGYDEVVGSFRPGHPNPLRRD